MHPLRHPRNAIFLGLIFVGDRRSSTGPSPTSPAGTSTTPGVTMLLRARDRDGAHGLRARRRLAQRLMAAGRDRR